MKNIDELINVVQEKAKEQKNQKYKIEMEENNMYNFDDRGQVIRVTITEEPPAIFAKVKFAYGSDVEGFWNETEFRKTIMEKCDGYTFFDDKRIK